MSVLRSLGAVAVGVAAVIVVGAVIQAPSIAAGGLLHPRRLVNDLPRPSGCVEREFDGDGLTLRGWYCAALTRRRGSVVYLHGVADNRSSAIGVIEHLTRRGFDVIAYDSRGHGQSGGDACTYGYFEKRDLGHVVNGLESGPVILIGNSLGAAVALQAAVGRPRITGVVAAEAFSDLRTIATERAPAFLPSWVIRRAFLAVEAQGRFNVDSVSPLTAAASLRIPVLLIHGGADHDTTPDHSQRLLSALAGPKRLILIPAAGHNQSMNAPGVWSEIDHWLDDVLLAGGRKAPASGMTQ